MNLNIKFKNPFKRLSLTNCEEAGTKKRTFIKADKQLYTVIGTAFAVSAVALLCYWFLKERPYYNNLLAEKDEVIKTLKFTRDKLKKIHENSIAGYEEKLKDEYILKSIYDDKINDYEQKLATYKDKYISKGEHEKQIAELEQRLKEETLSEETLSKKDYAQKVSALEQKVSALEEKNLDLKAILQKSAEFIKGEKDALENMLTVERKNAFIPSLILPETKNNALTADVLKKLVAIKEKLQHIEEMNIPLKSETYFGMGIVSYYNKQTDESIEQWENAVSLNKYNLKAYLCLGIVYNEENMSDNAIMILKRAIEINPKYATTHLILARIYEHKGALDNAVYEYLKVLEITPDAVDVHNKLGILYEKKGLKEEAKKSFAQYERLRGGNK